MLVPTHFSPAENHRFLEIKIATRHQFRDQNIHQQFRCFQSSGFHGFIQRNLDDDLNVSLGWFGFREASPAV